MTELDTGPRLGPAADAVYAALVAAHAGLDAAESARLNARLALILVNQIGDPEVVAAAVAAARRGLGSEGRG